MLPIMVTSSTIVTLAAETKFLSEGQSALNRDEKKKKKVSLSSIGLWLNGLFGPHLVVGSGTNEH